MAVCLPVGMGTDCASGVVHKMDVCPLTEFTTQEAVAAVLKHRASFEVLIVGFRINSSRFVFPHKCRCENGGVFFRGGGNPSLSVLPSQECL